MEKEKSAWVDLSQEELVEKEKTLRKELFNLRFQAAMGHIENPNRFKVVRKDIARILTIAGMQKNNGAASETEG